MSLAIEGRKVRVGIIGAGAVSDYHHVPGIDLDPRAEVVAACDMSEALLERRKADELSDEDRRSLKRKRNRQAIKRANSLTAK